MFAPTADAGHRCMCAMLKAGHRIPRTIDYDYRALEGGGTSDAGADAADG